MPRKGSIDVLFSDLPQHKTKWTVVYRLLKWQGGKMVEGRATASTRNEAYQKYYKAALKIYNDAPKGMYYRQYIIICPRATHAYEPERFEDRNEQSFTSRDPRNPYGKGRKK